MERAVGAGYLGKKANVRGEVAIPAFGAHSARKGLSEWITGYFQRQKAATEQKRLTKTPRPDIKPMKIRSRTKYDRQREARNRN